MRPWGARAGGKARGVLIVTEDTTRQTEVELQSQHSAKLAALGEMAGSIAHEINTPLATIGILSAQMAEILRDLENSPEFKESLHELRSKASLIESTISRISKISGSLRSMARDDSHEDWERVLIDDIVKDALSLCSERFRTAGVELQVDESPRDFWIFGSRTGVAQVLLNLLNNAWDASRAQGPGSRASSRVKVEITSKMPGWVQISVVDQGAAISPEVEHRLFQPFFTTKPPGQGTGIGLPLSKRIIEAHGGKVTFEQRAGLKSFIVELPQAVT
jgi:C4-dicarboxylate-specific signal transduction histidine kinase